MYANNSVFDLFSFDYDAYEVEFLISDSIKESVPALMKSEL